MDSATTVLDSTTMPPMPSAGGGEGPLIVFAGGGTGGHLYPALAVADVIRLGEPSARFVFFGTRRRIDADVLASTGNTLIAQSLTPPTAIPWRWPGLIQTWRSSMADCRRYFRANRPAVVVGTGAFASVPPVWQAARMGIPTAILNPDAVPGRANRFLARRVHSLLAQWAESTEHFGPRVNVVVTGCPIRKQFATADHAHGIARFGLRPERKTLLITGASLGAHSVNVALMALAPRLVKLADWQILHLTGKLDLASVEAAYEDAGAAATCLAYTDDMPLALAAADLVVARAGASTLAEITAVGRPAILMPYPHHRDEHQLVNARILASRGAAWIVRDEPNPQQTIERLGSLLTDLMSDENQRAQMALCARRIGSPRAADAVAERVLEIAECRMKIASRQ